MVRVAVFQKIMILNDTFFHDKNIIARSTSSIIMTKSIKIIFIIENFQIWQIFSWLNIIFLGYL